MNRTKPEPAPPYRYELRDVTPKIGDWVQDSTDGDLLQIVAVFPDEINKTAAGERALWTAVATDWEYEAEVVSQWEDGSGWNILRRSK